MWFLLASTHMKPSGKTCFNGFFLPYIVMSNSNVNIFRWDTVESSSWTIMMEDNSNSLSRPKYCSSRMNSLQLKHKLTKGGCVKQLWVSWRTLGRAGELWTTSSHAPEHIITHTHTHTLWMLLDYCQLEDGFKIENPFYCLCEQKLSFSLRCDQKINVARNMQHLCHLFTVLFIL